MKPTLDAPSRTVTRLVHEAEGAASGALAGAVMGAVAGPPGVVAGAVIGSVVGALAGAALDGQAVDTATRDAKLDEEIGVSTGELGAPSLEHPEATRGAYSAASTGNAGAGETTPAEGPLEEVG